MRSIRLAAALMTLLSGLLGGCVASKNPIGPAAEAAGEPRLAGTWQYDGAQGHEWDYLHVFVSDDGKTLDVVAVNSGERAWAVLSGHITAIGSRRFVNLRVSAASASVQADLDRQGHADSHPYSFIAYRLDGDDRLSLDYPLEPLQQAVKKGRLAGELVGDHDVFISDSSAKIAAVLGSTADADLFDDPQVYRRVASPPAP